MSERKFQPPANGAGEASQKASARPLEEKTVLSGPELFKTPFAKEIGELGLDCITCKGASDSWAERKNATIAERFEMAYKIKEKHGLMTEQDGRILSMLKAMMNMFRNKMDVDQLWLEFHGMKSNADCLQPAMWQKGEKTIQVPESLRPFMRG